MKNDRKYLIIFIIFFILLIFLISYNLINNKKVNNIERKIYLINNYTYEEVYNRGMILFNNSIKLINNNFEYEKDKNGRDYYYAIRDFNKYKRIINFQLIASTLSKKEITKYYESREIVIDDDKYYIKNYDKYESNYIGSIIKIEKVDNNYIYFNSQNFYCDNYEFLGVIEDIPSCDKQIANTSFTLVLEDNVLKINDLDEIKKIY